MTGGPERWGGGDPGGWAQQYKPLSFGVVHCPSCWAMPAVPTATHRCDSRLTSLWPFLVDYFMSCLHSQHRHSLSPHLLHDVKAPKASGPQTLSSRENCTGPQMAGCEGACLSFHPWGGLVQAYKGMRRWGWELVGGAGVTFRGGCRSLRGRGHV